MRIQKLLVALLCLLISCAPKTPSLAFQPPNGNPGETLSPSIKLNTLTPVPTIHENAFTQIPGPNPTEPATLTPLPTLTPYPTFEINDAITHTPFPPAQCPPTDPNKALSLEMLNETANRSNFGSVALKALEKGASFDQVLKVFHQIPIFQRADDLKLLDATGDGVPELVIDQPFNLVVIGCDNGKYSTLLDFNPTHNWPPKLVAAQDMNLNGVPELVLTYSVTSGGNSAVDILEWNGTVFKSLIQANHGKNSASTSALARALYWYSQPNNANWSENPDSNTPTMNGGAKIVIRDMDNNGTQELILTDKGPLHPDTIYTYGPWRGQQVVFKWDGLHYLYSSLTLAPPVYRFQAIQDADRLFFMGEYDQSLAMYQNVIFDDKLDWWSEEKMMNIKLSYFADMQNNARPAPPTPDTDEYIKLAAYARFRIMMYHLVKGQVTEASITYKTLLKTSPPGSIGYAYSEVASLLWDDYQKTQNLKRACLPVVQYTKIHQGMLDVLGNDLHGRQSHLYAVEDICPFK